MIRHIFLWKVTEDGDPAYVLRRLNELPTRIPGYRVAGKTGTAARSNGHGGYTGAGYTASFEGMAPADHPKLVCGVVLDRPLHGYFGGAVAAPVFSSPELGMQQARDVLAGLAK